MQEKKKYSNMEIYSQNWYKIALEEQVFTTGNPKFLDFLKQYKPKSLWGLAAEALKSPSFEDFEYNFLGQIKHGTYWHITDNPNFTIDPLKGPRDMSSMAIGKMTPGALMVTTHLENWIPAYPDRKYVAEIDMSAVKPEDYYQVKRGFGNEFYVKNPSKAKVIRVISVEQALKIDRYRHGKIPQSQEALKSFYDNVWTNYRTFNESELV